MFDELAGNDGIEPLGKGECLGVGHKHTSKAEIAHFLDFLLTLVDAHHLREALYELAVQPMRGPWFYDVAATSHVEDTRPFD
jgi:hypothetical protein